MKHPYQHIVLSDDGKYFFAAAINSVFVFKLENEHAKLVGSWTDEVDPYYSIRKHHKELLEEYERQQKEKELKEELVNENNKRETIPDEQVPTSKKQKINKKPKLPLPGPGAPPTYTYIRDMCLSRDNKNLIVTTDNDKAVVVFKLDLSNSSNVLKLVKRQPFPKRPSAVCTSYDDSSVIIADKFGDVYAIPLNEPTIIENDKDLIPILGHVSMLTCVQSAIDENGKQVVLTADRDEHIRVSYYPKSFVVKKWLFGHREFVSCFLIPQWCDGKVLVSAGGDSFIKTWNWQAEGELKESISTIDISHLVEGKLNEKHLTPEKFQNEAGDQLEYCISHLVSLAKSKQIAVVFERIPSVFVFDLTNSGELSFNKEYQVSNDIITATASQDKLILSLDSMDKCLQIFKIEEGKDLETLSDAQDMLKEINAANDTVIGDIDEIIPLFNTNYLRKRREY